MTLYPNFLGTAQVNKPGCTLVQLSLLTLRHTLYVFQINAHKFEAQISVKLVQTNKNFDFFQKTLKLAIALLQNL